MLTIKVISHPLRKIQLLMDDSKITNETENQLLDSYVRLHDLINNLEKERLALEECFSNHRIFKLEIKRRFDGIEPRMDKLINGSQKLMEKQSSYKVFRKGYDTFIQEAEDYNLDYNRFYARFEEMTKDNEMLIMLHNRVEESEVAVSKAMDDHLALVDELFRSPEKTTMDWTSYYIDKGELMKLWEISLVNLGHIVKGINFYSAEEYNPFLLRFNDAISRFRIVNETIVKLRNTYLAYTKATEIESMVLRLNWDDETLIPEEVESVDYGISYDLEKAANGGIILHLDMELVLENLLHLWMRASYRMKCKKEEIFTQEIMEPLVGHCMEEMKNVITVENSERVKKLDIRWINISYEMVEGVTAGYLEVITDGDGVWNEPADMYAPAIHIKSPGMFRLMGITMVNVMDQVLFSNKEFDCRRNRHALNEIVSLSQFTTLKLLLPKMEKGEIILNNRQYILFLSLLDCTCQLLLGDKGDYLIERLERVKMTAELRMNFLQMAQKHYNEALENFRENNITITFLEETRDWNRVFY